MVERVEFYDDPRDAGSADAYLAFERHFQCIVAGCLELEHGNGVGDVYRSGIDVIWFYDDGIEPDGSHGSLSIGERSCEQHAVLLGSERDECRRHGHMVECVELYDDHRDAGVADACIAFEQRNEPTDLTDPELEHGNGGGDVFRSGIDVI